MVKLEDSGLILRRKELYFVRYWNVHSRCSRLILFKISLINVSVIFLVGEVCFSQVVF